MNRELRQLINTANLTYTLTCHLLSSALHQGIDGDSSQVSLINYFLFPLSLINKTPRWRKPLDLLSKEEISKEALPPWEASSRRPWIAETFQLPNKRYFISNYICTFFPPLFEKRPPPPPIIPDFCSIFFISLKRVRAHKLATNLTCWSFPTVSQMS